MASATAPAIQREILEDRYQGALFVEDDPTDVYDKLNDALFEIAQTVARKELMEDVGQVVEEAHAAIRELVITRTAELGLAR